MRFPLPLRALVALAGPCTLLTPALALDSPDAVVTFNEVSYNPATSQDDEWLELSNQMAVSIDLSGWSLADGVSYSFPEGTIIAPGAYLVVAKTPSSPVLAGVGQVYGPFSGNLSNSGETVDLINRAGRLMDRITYSDSGLWPVAADGAGGTLAKKAEGMGSEKPASWRASLQTGGTPGRRNFPSPQDTATTQLIDGSSTWQVYDQAAAPPAAWNLSTFNAAAWRGGQGPFATEGAPITPILSATAALTGRYRAGALTGIADGAVVNAWPDAATDDGASQDGMAIGSPRFATAATTTGEPAVSFSGSDAFHAASGPGISGNSGFVYFIVCKGSGQQDAGGVGDGSGSYLFDRDSSVNDPPLVSLKADSGRYGFQKRYDDNSSLGGPVSTTPIATDRFQIVAVRRNPAAARFEIWVDGVMEATSSDNGKSLTPQPLVIGRHGSNAGGGFHGEIAELLVYADALSDADFSSAGGYLASRYGISSSFPQFTAKTTLSAAAPVSYLRRDFSYQGDPTRTALNLDYSAADGAVFYLNGQEIARSNLPAGQPGQGTNALTDVPAPVATGYQTVPATALVRGSNTLAVALYGSATQPGTYLSARLKAVETPPDPDTAPDLVLNECAAVGASSFFIEIRNVGAAAVSTAGYHLRTLGTPAYDYALPAVSLDAGALTIVTEAQLGGRPADGDKLVLVRPDGSLADVRAASTTLRGRSTDYPDRWLFPSAATPGTANAFSLHHEIVIDEINYHPVDLSAASDNRQWLELTNRGGSVTDLSGWSFSSGITYTFPAGTTLAPGAFLVVAKSPPTVQAAHPGIAIVGPFSGSLSHKGELLTLQDAAGNPANEVSYLDGGRWPDTPDGGGSSLELKDVRADNSIPESWAASNEMGRRHWETFTYTGVAAASKVGPDGQWNDFVFGLLDEGEVLIDDLRVIENPGASQVSLIGNGDFSSGSTGWRFLGNHSHATVIDDPFSPGNKVLDLKATGGTEHMHNHVETTLSGGRQIVNGRTYQISFRACWISGSNQFNTRLYFNRLTRTTLLTRTDEGGTPGAPNSTAVANAGPVFSSFRHSPAVPAPSQPVTITASVADPDGIAGLKVYSSVNGAAFTSTDMTGNGGGTYTATLPGQSAGTVVRFYVAATDAAPIPAIAFFPAAGPDGHALYEVDDGEAATNGLHNIRIVMDPADKALLYQTTNLMSNDGIGCTTIYDEKEIYYETGVRLKSSERGRGDPARVGFALSFNPDQPFRGAHKSIAIDRSEGGITGCQEICYNHMMYAGGLISGEFNDLVKVIAPDSTHSSAAILQMARFSNVFLDSAFENGSDGSVYEYELIYYPLTADANGYKLPQPDSVVGVPVTSLGDNKEDYRLSYINKNETADDFSRIIALAKCFDLSGAAFDAQIDQTIDTTEYLTALAYDCAIGAGDNYFSNSQHNTQFYARPSDGRILLFPHDDDLGYQYDRNIYECSDLQKLIVNPARKRTYLSQLHRICTTVYNRAYMSRWTTEFGALLPGQDFAGHLDYIDQRSTYILNAINSSVAPLPFAITTNGGAAFTTSSSPVTLAGQGWIDVQNIRVEGSTVPLTVTWTSVNTWQLSLPLFTGANAITLEAVDSRGAVLGTASITIQYTGTLQPPAAGNLVISQIYYNPPGSDETTEYIELLNIGNLPLDMSGVAFTAGLTFTFPSGTMLLPRARTLVVKDTAAFAAKFGTGLPVAGSYPNNLSNSGETLTLKTAGGAVILSFAYSDQPPWPTAADGDGYSLVLLAPFINPDPAVGANWRASVALGGSPGVSDVQSYDSWKSANGNLPDSGDADGDGLTNRMEYLLGGNPAVAEPTLRPAYSFAANGAVTVSVTRRAAADGAAYVLQTSTDLVQWTSAPASGLVSTVRLAGTIPTDRLTYQATPPAGSSRWFVRLVLP